MAGRQHKETEPVESFSLTRSEMIQILEEIARDGSNAAARIAAIKQLEAMRRGEESTEGGFGALDDNLADHVRKKAA